MPKIGENNSDQHKRTQKPQNKGAQARKLRQLENKARMQARKEHRAVLRNNRKNFQQNKQEILQNQKDLTKENKTNQKHRIEEMNAQNREITQSKKETRQKNWRRSRIRQQRRAKQFRKFRSRVWWKGYLTILGWILLIFIVVIGIFYILKLSGIDLLEIVQGNTSPELILKFY